MPVVAISLAVCALCCHNGRMIEPTSPNLSAASPKRRNPGLRLPQGLISKLLILLIIFLASLGLGVRLWYGPAVPVHVVQQEALQQSVVSTGRVSSLSRVAVGSLVLGTLTQVTVREGARVRRGDLLAAVRDDEAQAAMQQARATLEEAQARLTQIDALSLPQAEQALKLADANLALAQDDYARTKRLTESGFYSPFKLEEVERNRQVALAQRASALALVSSNRSPGSDVALALARRDQAQAAMQAAAVRLANNRILAPADGVVLRRLAEPGDVVAQGRQLFELAVGSETQLLLQVDEKNLRLVAVGQQALAVTDAFPDQRFEAEVFYIAPSVDALRGTVEVKLRVPQPPAFLRTDMTVSAEIKVAQRERTLTLDSSAVRDAAGVAGSPWVLLVQQGRLLRRAVTLGLRGEGRMEILSGLVAGDQVIAPVDGNAVGLSEGMRVRPQSQSQSQSPLSGR